MKNSLQIGDFVRYKRRYGLVSAWNENSTFYRDGLSVEVAFHNGIKIVSNSCLPSELTKISEEEFWKHNKGNTSFYYEIKLAQNAIERISVKNHNNNCSKNGICPCCGQKLKKS